MNRTLFGIFVLFAVCLTLSAQGTGTKLTAAERLKLLQLNQDLIQELIDSSLKLSKSSNPLDAAEQHVEVSLRLGRSLDEAIQRGDADRAAEVATLLDNVVSEALTPQLKEAGRTIISGSPNYDRYVECHRKAYDRVAKLAAAMPADGNGWKAERVVNIRTQLAKSLEKIGPPPASKGCRRTISDRRECGDRVLVEIVPDRLRINRIEPG
jgi:hypothetical protein